MIPLKKIQNSFESFQNNWTFQIQTPEVFYKKSCSETFRNIYRKTPLLESVSNTVTGMKACNFVKKRLQHRCFLVNIAKFWRTPILKKICERLLHLRKFLKTAFPIEHLWWMYLKFSEKLFSRTPAYGCFWMPILLTILLQN